MKSILSIAVLFIISISLSAQYFGKNKPRYTNFDFKVKETPHFRIHYYTKNKDLIDRLGEASEQWYALHEKVLKDTFYHKNPIIFYDNHGDFQQTNTISGSIGVGTGGVTEGLKNRVVLPYTFTNQQTHHVLGHELVHAFQYHIVIGGDSTSISNLANIPLWMIEGLAEYMSIGRNDPFTAMWMRDAVLAKNIPTIKDLSSSEYFPYRYGQAFWAFITGVYGDDVIRPFLENTAKYGLDPAVRLLFNTSLENLSSAWVGALETHYAPYVEPGEEREFGKTIVSRDNGGRINVSPAVSPNGRHVIFLSEKDLFSTDLFLADVRTGEIIKKVASTIKDGHLDAFSFIESSGTWSPDSRQFAFVAFKKGKTVLVIKEALSGNTIEEFPIKGVPSITNPAWSPNGNDIVFTGLKDGQTDLFSVNLRNKRVTQLTDDIYAEIQPQFDKSGSILAFSTDEKSMKLGRNQGRYTFDIAIINLDTGEKDILDIFYGADNLNPQFDSQGNIYFLSNRDGFRNLYKYETIPGKTFKQTDFIVGISGITQYAPALAIGGKKDKILYTKYLEGHYSIEQLDMDKALNEAIPPDSLATTAGTLPVTGLNVVDHINPALSEMDTLFPQSRAEFRNDKYRANFKLDYVTGATGVAIGSSNTFGNYTGLQGGIGLLFSDMLGNNQIFTQLAMNGEIIDVGGQVAYLNRKNQLAWGASMSHIPLRTGFQDFSNIQRDASGFITSYISELHILRVFDDNLTVFGHYPFSTRLRLEGYLSGTSRTFRYDIYRDQIVYEPGFGYFVVGSDRTKQPTGDEFRLNQYYTLVKGFGAQTGVALVGDNSYFGLTSPLAGHRFRLGVDRVVGADDYTSVVADYRRYFWKKPFSFGFRTMTYLRFEKVANSVYPFYLGDMGFVRGYGSIFSYNIIEDLGLDYGQLLGSKIALANFEVRIPFTGPKQLSLIGSRSFFSDLAIFFDAGIAFDDFDHLKNGEPLLVTRIDPETGQLITVQETRKPPVLTSAGFAMRINLYGAMILEPYLAWQFREGRRATFGLNFIPGW